MSVEVLRGLEKRAVTSVDVSRAPGEGWELREVVRRSGAEDRAKAVDRPEVLVVGGVSRLKAVGRHRLADLAGHHDPSEAADEFAAVAGPNRVVVRPGVGRRGDRLPGARRETATRRVSHFHVTDVWLWCVRKARWSRCGR